MPADESPGEVVELCDLDGSSCADALASSQSALVHAERLQVELVAQWCDLHSGPDRRSTRAGGRVLPGQQRSLVIGGDGTPAVREFAAAELGVLLGTTTTGAQGLMRDVLGLRHRHPRLYALVRAGQARFFQARHVARTTLTAGLTVDQARHVDDRVAPFLGQVSWGRIMGLVEAAVIEADPEAAEQRRVAAEMARFVRTGRSGEYGTTMIYARARAGDAVFFLAMCDRIAQILKLRRDLEVAGHSDRCVEGPTGLDAQVEMDVLRSEAIGILASPVQALALLQWAEQHTRQPGEPPDTGGGDASGAGGASPSSPGTRCDPDGAGSDPSHAQPAWGRPARGPRARDSDEPEAAQWHLEPEPPEWEPDEPEERRCPPPVVRDASVNPEAFRSTAVLYVHVSHESFRGEVRGVARVEGVGPVTIEQAVDFLRNCQVTVRPVIDLNANPSADGYEVSALVRETVGLRHPVETFPHGTLTSRRADADHIRPYRRPAAAASAGSLPQTNADNLQPLGRLHHRLKTDGGWSCTSPERGVVLWRSPHGHWTRVDATGSTYIGRLEGAPVIGQVVDAHHALLLDSPRVRI